MTKKRISLFFTCFLILCGQFVFASAGAEEISSLDQKLSSAIHYNTLGPNQIGYLHLAKDAPIQESTYLYVKFALSEFKKMKVPFVVLDIDSPGGEVFAALKISQELKKLDIEDHIPVVAFVDNWALSAGALLAYSCRFIGTTTDASMGAAEPVTMGEGKMESAPEKINSALRAEFSNTARFFGRDPLLAEAMVDKDIILVKRGGKIVRLEAESDIIHSGKTPDVVVSRKGKLLTLDAMQMMELGVSDFQVPYQSLEEITIKEKQQGNWPFSSYLLSKEPFFSKIPNATLTGYQNSKIDFFAFLSHPLVSSLLMMGLMIGIYGEMSHPGFGLFGCIALLCLSLILLSSFAIHTIDFLEIILLAAGAILLCVEIFILPGFGFVGVLGILLMLGALIALMLPQVSGVSFSYDLDQWSLPAIELIKQLGLLVGAILLSVVVMSILSRFITKRRHVLKHLVLSGEQDKEEGFVAVPSHKDLPKEGEQGIAYTSLRPSGKVLVRGTLYDAQADILYIEKDQPVIISRHEGGKIIVKLKGTVSK